VAFVYAGAYPEVSGSMTLGEPVFSLAILPIFLIISLLSKYEARRYWLSLKLCGEIDSAHSNIRRVLNVLLLLVAYPSVFPYVPYFLYYLLTLLSVFSALADALTVVGLILAIAAIILLFYGLSLLSAFRKRKKLIERIRRTADREGYILSEIRSPLRAMLNPSEPYASFTLTRGNESFVCKFVPTLRRATYFYFTSPTEGYFRHRLGTKHHHITLNHQISFPAGDEVGQRVLIVNPAPKHVFVEEFGGSKEITPGTKIWDAVMYDGETFVGCMERHCLCKTTPWTD